jgi:beta-glucosidase
MQRPAAEPLQLGSADSPSVSIQGCRCHQSPAQVRDSHELGRLAKRLVSQWSVAARRRPGTSAAHGAAGVAPLPSTFHCGMSAPGFQAEGSAPDSNWSRYNATGAPSVKDRYVDSVDGYHHWEEDLARAKALGVNTYRFAMEWARIQPARGTWSAEAFEHYVPVFGAVVAAGMTPMVTLLHFVHPG